MLFWFLFPNPDPKLEEGEYFIHKAKRHWIILLQRLIIPVGIIAVMLLTVLFRLSGAEILSTTDDVGRFDAISILIVLGIGGLLFAYFRSRARFPKNRAMRRNYIFGVLVLIGLLFFYLAGGQLVAFTGPSSGMDGLNTLLVVASLIMLLVIDFTVYDWRSDDLIVTNMRVIYEDYVPFFKDFRLQTEIDNVQSVVAKSETYLQNLLGYGTVIVQSAGQTRIVFTGCSDFESEADPLTGFRKRVSQAQKFIQAEVDKRRNARSPLELSNLIEKQVYGQEQVLTQPPVSVRAGRGGSWIFPQNPTIRGDKNRTVIWHKFWLFGLLELFRPLLTLALLSFGLLLLAGAELVEPGTIVTLALVMVVVILAWSWYVIEDYRNDLYILTLNNIIDIEKKPFGPENRRQAGLGQVQNVTYTTTFFGNLLGYGDVFVETAAASGRFTFHRVPKPRDVATTINDYLNSFRQGDRERSLRETLQVLKEYHEAQVRHDELRRQP
jgi:uncharacterized membrane protein